MSLCSHFPFEMFFFVVDFLFKVKHFMCLGYCVCNVNIYKITKPILNKHIYFSYLPDKILFIFNKGFWMIYIIKCG